MAERKDRAGPLGTTANLVSKAANAAGRRRSATPEALLSHSASPTVVSVPERAPFGARPSVPTPLAEPTPKAKKTPPETSPVLRRTESVIRDAKVARRAPAHLSRVAAKRLSAALDDAAHNVVIGAGKAGRWFGRLRRWQQVMLVTTPYVTTVVLVGALLAGRSAPATAVPVRAADLGPTAATPPPPPPAPPPPAPPAPPSQHTVTLPRRSALFIRPDPAVTRAARLRRGHVVTVFPDFPTPAGWALATSEKGTVGFISTHHLEGRPDPRFRTARRTPRRRARRGAKTERSARKTTKSKTRTRIKRPPSNPR